MVKRPFSVAIFYLLFFVLIIKLLYLWDLSSNPMLLLSIHSDVFDQFRFYSLANSFMTESWLGTAITRYSPAYSYFIAFIFFIFGNNQFYVFAVQMIVGLISIVVFYKTASLLFENRAVGVIASFLAAFYSVYTFYEGTLLRASLVGYAHLAAFYFILYGLKKEKNKYYFFSGLLLGFSHILRSNYLFVFVFLYLLSLVFFQKRKLFKPIILLFLGLLVFIAPLNVRNHMLSGDVRISRQGPSTFWIGNTHDSSGIGLWRSPLRAKMAKEAEGSYVKTIKILIREVKKHPKDYLLLYKQKIIMFFNGYEIPGNISFDHFKKEHPILKMLFVSFSIICPLFIFGFFISCRGVRYDGLLKMFVLLLIFSTILFHIQSRYRIPATPFFILYAAYALFVLSDSFQKRKIQEVVISLIIVLGLSYTVSPNIKIIKKYFGAEIRIIDHHNLAAAYHWKYINDSKNLTLLEKRNLMLKAIESYKAILSFIPEDNFFYYTKYLLNTGVFYDAIGEKELSKEFFKEIFALCSNEEERLHFKEEIDARKKAFSDPKIRYSY
jgi:4-amino-4-deoxy-L-arabinose transferase-like glycosyltransferase